MKTKLIGFGMVSVLAVGCGANSGSHVDSYGAPAATVATAPSAQELAAQQLHIRNLMNRLSEKKNAGAIYMVGALAKFSEGGKLVTESLVRDVALVFSESNISPAQSIDMSLSETTVSPALAIYTALSTNGNIDERLVSDIERKFTVHGNIGERLAIAVYNVFTQHGNVGERLKNDIIAQFTKASPDVLKQQVVGSFTETNNTIAAPRVSRLGY